MHVSLVLVRKVECKSNVLLKMSKTRETIKKLQKQKELFLEDCGMVFKNCIELL